MKNLFLFVIYGFTIILLGCNSTNIYFSPEFNDSIQRKPENVRYSAIIKQNFAIGYFMQSDDFGSTVKAHFSVDNQANIVFDSLIYKRGIGSGGLEINLLADNTKQRKINFEIFNKAIFSRPISMDEWILISAKIAYDYNNIRVYSLYQKLDDMLLCESISHVFSNLFFGTTYDQVYEGKIFRELKQAAICGRSFFIFRISKILKIGENQIDIQQVMDLSSSFRSTSSSKMTSFFNYDGSCQNNISYNKNDGLVNKIMYSISASGFEQDYYFSDNELYKKYNSSIYLSVDIERDK
jgi:hypothetical protein